MTRKFLLAVAAWFAKPFVKRNMPVTDDGRNALEAELVELRERLVEFHERVACLENELQKEKSGNKVLRAFIDARMTPDKTLTAPPKIVKPYAVIAALAFALCAQGAFPPPYVHNYWDTNLVPTDASTLTNAASAQTLTDAAGLTNGIIPAARYVGTGPLSVNLGSTAHASGSGGVTIGSAANTGATGGSTAVGAGADAENGLSSAFGNGAFATFANSTAIGYSAATTKTNQIMLGTAAEEVRVAGTLVVDGKMSGNGAGITNIPNSSLTNVALLNANQTFTGSNAFAGTVSNSISAYDTNNVMLFGINPTNSKVSFPQTTRFGSSAATLSGFNSSGQLGINILAGGRDLSVGNGFLVNSGTTTFNLGIGSYPTDAPLTINPTGITNTLGKQATALMTVTSAGFSVKNNAGTTNFTTAANITQFVTIPLQPGGAIMGASGLSGSVIPW